MLNWIGICCIIGHVVVLTNQMKLQFLVKLCIHTKTSDKCCVSSVRWRHQHVNRKTSIKLMVRRGDPGTYRHLGRRRRSEGTEGFRPQRIRLRRNFGEDARPRLLENLGAVPLESQVTEEQLSTVLRQEEVRSVCLFICL